MSSKILADLTAEQVAKREQPLVDVKVGDTVNVVIGIKEKEKDVKKGKEAEEKIRAQLHTGIVLKQPRKDGVAKTLTIRKISNGIGVEMTFPLNSAVVQSLEIKKHGNVRQARLLHLRGKYGKAAKVKERMTQKSEK